MPRPWLLALFTSLLALTPAWSAPPRQTPPIEGPGQVITAWSVSGPYRVAGDDGLKSLTTPFAPEKGRAVEWEMVQTEDGVLDLAAAFGTGRSAAYLFTNVQVKQAGDFELRLGSDDGVAVWLRGENVHLNPARRAVAPNQDRVRVRLEAGDNPLVLKVANAGGRWGAFAAVAGPKDAMVGMRTRTEPPETLRLAPLRDPRQQKIAAALPDAAPAKPSQPRRLLVFTLTRGFRHASIPTGVEALTQLGRKTGAFEVVHSEDIAVFGKKSLEKFDGICFLSTTGELFRHPQLDQLQGDERKRALARQERLQQNLIDFVKNGKGFCGIHAATDTLYRFEEYGKMIGGYFDGHPWHEEVGVTVEEPEHRLVSFLGEEFTVTDEIYQIKAPYSRFQQRVLLSLDTMRTNMKKKGIRRKDGDFPISWVKPHGEGRVFYCSLGHRDEIFWNPKVLEHYLAGIQYILGDLKVPDAPRK